MDKSMLFDRVKLATDHLMRNQPTDRLDANHGQGVTAMQTAIRQIIRTSMTCIVERFEAEHGAYPFLNTKFDVVTGRDFGEEDEPFRRRDCIYAWIQGRGLESLARHAEYFSALGDDSMAERLKIMLAAVTAKMEVLRQVNAGRLPFAMRPDGSPFFAQEPSVANFSDLFYAKGLLASGQVLKHPLLQREARTLFLRVLTAIRNREFHTDQQSFDPKNKVAFVPGKFPQGARMIALGGIADWLAAEPEEPFWADVAEEFIRFILTYHVNTGTSPELQKFDFIESVDAERRAWRDGSMIFCDPGHALEFIGLAGRCLRLLQKQERKPELVAEAGAILPELFRHVFDYGFNRTAGGICKGYDLISRCPVNSDLPWWSLPETVRAGAGLIALYPDRLRHAVALRTGAAMQAFTQGFLQSNGFGCQTRSAEGKIIRVIPAVPDADPGYHTNLALMDALPLLGHL